jgi:DNA-binding CsgD family transcriptional regulator
MTAIEGTDCKRASSKARSEHQCRRGALYGFASSGETAMQSEAGTATDASTPSATEPLAHFSLLDMPCFVLAKDSRHDGGVRIGELQLFGRRFVIALDPTNPGPPGAAHRSCPGLRRLTRREREIALLVAHGYLTKQIAHELGLSPHTVTAYVSRIFVKLSVHNRAEMVAAMLLLESPGGDLNGSPLDPSPDMHDSLNMEKNDDPAGI